MEWWSDHRHSMIFIKILYVPNEWQTARTEIFRTCQSCSVYSPSQNNCYGTSVYTVWLGINDRALAPQFILGHTSIVHQEVFTIKNQMFCDILFVYFSSCIQGWKERAIWLIKIIFSRSDDPPVVTWQQSDLTSQLLSFQSCLDNRSFAHNMPT